METETKNLTKRVEVGFKDLRGDIKLLSSKFDCLDKKYITRNEFAPVQKIAYTIVGAAGLAVLGGLISLVIK